MEFGSWGAAKVAIPWTNDDRFPALYHSIREKALVSMDRCWTLYALARNRAGVRGAMAECGVYKGGTARLLATLAKEQSKQIYLFDTFSGIPDGMPGIDTYYEKGGHFADTSRESVHDLIGPTGAVYRILAGLIPKTFEGLGLETFSFVHLDLDIYLPTIEALRFFYHRMAPGGVIVLDDYGFPECPGVRLAADEFGMNVGAPPVSIPTGQALFIAP